MARTSLRLLAAGAIGMYLLRRLLQGPNPRTGRKSSVWPIGPAQPRRRSRSTPGDLIREQFKDVTQEGEHFQPPPRVPPPEPEQAVGHKKTRYPNAPEE